MYGEGSEGQGFSSTAGEGGGQGRGGSRGQSHVVARGGRGYGNARGRGGRGGEGRGGSGHRGSFARGSFRTFSVSDFAKGEDIDEVTLSLHSQLQEFEKFVSSDSISADDVQKTLRILNRVLQNDLQREIVLKILQVVCTSRFLDTHLLSLIHCLPSFPESTVIETVEFIHQLLTKVCHTLPSYASKGYLLLLALTSMPSIVEIMARSKPSLAGELKELLDECQRCMKMLHEAGQRRGNAARVSRGRNEDDDIPPDDFAELPIFPNARDMDWAEKIFLRANKEEGAFRDVNHYLDVQFRLLREDYIRPLRKGIKEFKELKDKGEVFKKSQHMRLYHKVRIIRMVCSDGLEHLVQFDMSRLTRVRWQSSQRLLYGSLVCLTMDDFENLFFATVTVRDNEALENGIIQIRFETGLENILGLASNHTFTMAETTAYFEAYRHVLEGLQEMKDALPMARYLVECNPTIKLPQYLLSAMGTGQMDLSSLLREDSRWDASAVTIINPQRWPTLKETTLNDSQLEAVRTALSKELAIIQGPPGTGKTYVGLKVAKVLLENREVWTDPEVGSRPILVVCYTNHALDQFLEGILEFCPTGIVRVGSRCKNPSLETFNLKNIRKERTTAPYIRDNIRACAQELASLMESIDDVSSLLEASTKGIVSTQILRPFMLNGQFESLTKETLSAAPVHSATMMEWLTNGMITQTAEENEEEEEDPCGALEKKVTTKILQGRGTCHEGAIDPNTVHSLPPAERARLYRSWQQKAMQQLHLHANLLASQSTDPQQVLGWLALAQREILPDVLLAPFISSHLYSSIASSLFYHYQRQTQFCIRTWLGLSAETSPAVASWIMKGREILNEEHVAPDKVNSLSRQSRCQLYRFWMQKAKPFFEREWEQDPEALKRVLEMAENEIFPDNVLKNVVDGRLMEAIKREVFQRWQRQSYFLIRAWLGIDIVCPDASKLERVLEQLDESKDQKEQSNIDEEADLIQNERVLDLGDNKELLAGFARKSSSLDVEAAMDKLGMQSTFVNLTREEAEAIDGFAIPSRHKRQLKKKLTHLLLTAEPMTEEEATRVVDVWNPDLSMEKRMSLYKFWLQRYHDAQRQSVKSKVLQYNVSAQKFRELRLLSDKDILVGAKVIGMTTTGAARYRRVLAAVACPIVILEEAAEVMEAHVVTTLHKKCQHLILIGDHQQLRPSPTVYELCRHYKLDLSLFERLVNNNLPHSTLAVQHRMRPEVARLVRHVYPNLGDHETTLGRPHIRGVKEDVFLFHHEVEETQSDETSSKSNWHEAELCVGLCRYLRLQDYPPDTITILTAYSGQLFILKNIINKQPSDLGVRVTTVDNYQGEENDVIILSLVRSNQEGSVGFLGTDNRVCVALSRARNGFYAFGNFKILADSSELWKKICRTAKDNGQLGDTLVLRCENHPDQEIKITTAKDFDKAPEGGCKLPCGTRLECGHACELICHGYDREHKDYRCEKKCARQICQLGHPCTKKCFQDCGQCLYKVEKTVPMCGHVATMECRKDPHTWDCQDRCQGKLPCGHQCSGICGDCRKKNSHVAKCMVEMEKVWPCGHLVKSPCHTPFETLLCRHSCGVTLDCGHVCKGTCGTCWSGRVHVACKEKCGRALPGCGHKCRLPCGTDCLPCLEKCGTTCLHGNCKKLCGTPCPPCNEACPWKSCRHRKCDAFCHQPCPPCAQPCGEKLKCVPQDPLEGQGHSCSGLCGEKCFCFTCDRKNFVPLVIDDVLTKEESVAVGEDTKLIKLPRCGHIFNVTVLDIYVKRKCQRLPPGGSLTCPVGTCDKMILEGDCWRYHRLLRERHDSFQEAKRKLITTTVFSKGRLQKLLNSLALLKHDAEKEKSFASKPALGQIFKKKFIDVNTAFALTNQIKLTRVFEMAAKALSNLRRLFGDQEDIKDGRILKRRLYQPMGHLTEQRRRELSAATSRFAYLTMLASAKQCAVSTELMNKIKSCFVSLEKGTLLEPGLKRDVEGVIDDCKQSCGSVWTSMCETIDVSILDAPPEQDLCDIVKSTTGKQAAFSVTVSKSSMLTAPRKQFSSTESLPVTIGQAVPQETPDPQHKRASSVPDDPQTPSVSGSSQILTSVPLKPLSSLDTLPTASGETMRPDAPGLQRSSVSDVPRRLGKSQGLAGPRSLAGPQGLAGPQRPAGPPGTSRLQYTRKELCDLNHSFLPSLEMLQDIHKLNLARPMPQNVFKSPPNSFAAVASRAKANVTGPEAHGWGLSAEPEDRGAASSQSSSPRSHTAAGQQNTDLTPSQAASLHAKPPPRGQHGPAAAWGGATAGNEGAVGVGGAQRPSDDASSTASHQVSNSLATGSGVSSSAFASALARASEIATKMRLSLSLASTSTVGDQPENLTE